MFLKRIFGQSNKSKRSRRRSNKPRRLAMETLTRRELLAVDIGAISGYSFLDATGNGLTGDDARLEGVAVHLYEDTDGDRQFSTGDIWLESTTTGTGADAGLYRFDDLSVGTYHVIQDQVNDYIFNPVTVTVINARGEKIQTIDDYSQTYQSVTANSSDADVSGSATAPEAIGGERDVRVQVTNERGQLTAFFDNNTETLSIGSLGDSSGHVLIQYDGGDASITLDASGLSNASLDGGAPGDAVDPDNGVVVRSRAELAGDELVITIYTDTNNYSRASIPIPLNETQFVDVFVPFSEFSAVGGTGANFNDVGAIEAEIDVSANNDVFAQVIESRRPAVVTANLQNYTEECYFSMFAGPRLVSISTTESVLLEGIFNALIPGTYIDLDVVDWYAISTGSFNINAMLTELQATLSLSSVSDVLNADVTLAQCFTAMADVIPADGPTAQLHLAILELATELDVPALNGTINLADLLRVDFPDGSFADIDISALNFLTGVIQLYNYENVATTTAPITIDGSYFGLVDVVDVTLWAQVIEPPIIDPLLEVGDQFHSAAIRIKLDVDIDDMLCPLDANVTLTDFELYLDIARAQGQINLVDTLRAAVNLEASHGVTNIYLGNIADGIFWNRTHVIDASVDVDWGQIGTVVNGVDLLSLEVKGWAEGTAPLATLVEFTGPYPESYTIGSSTTFVANALNDLITTMDIRTTLLGVVIPDTTAGIRNIISDITYTRLLSIMYGFDPLVSYVGVGVGEMHVTIMGYNCGPTVRNDNATVEVDHELVISVLSNDQGDVDPTTVEIVTQPLYGSLVINAVSGHITYRSEFATLGHPTVTTNALGITTSFEDGFTYTVRNSKGAVSNLGTVYVTVTPDPDNDETALLALDELFCDLCI